MLYKRTISIVLAAIVCIAFVSGCKPISRRTPLNTASPDPAALSANDQAQTGVVALNPGDSDENVKNLQLRLMQLQYFENDEATGYYGSVTTESVKLFQRTNNLVIDGIASAQTLELLYSGSAKKYIIEQGNSGTVVAALQRRLKALHYFSASATGYYGSATVDAIKSFQKRNGLHTDGIAGERTLGLLYSGKAKSATLAVGTSASVSKSVSAFLATAQSQLGRKYVSGNEGPDSFDCSGFVYYCLKQCGVNIGRLSAAGFSGVDRWKTISKSNLKAGDILFFGVSGSKKVGHTGIYLGSGKMIHCSSGKGKVVVADISSGYWVKNYRSAKRVF